jgi:hypothetical protein
MIYMKDTERVVTEWQAKAVAIIFTYPLEKDVRVLIDEVFDWYDKQDKMWSPSKVEWKPGTFGDDSPSFSFAKGWWDAGEDAINRLVRVGSGAYGGTTILKRYSYREQSVI